MFQTPNPPFSKMDSTKPSKPKLATKISKFLHLQNAASTSSNSKSQKQNSPQNRINHSSSTAAITEAFIAKLFAEIASLKAAYAELQVAQFPYSSSAVQAADGNVVAELKAISELKRKYFTKQFDRISLSPQVGLLLAEIQEQQSLIKLYQITLRKMEGGLEIKDAEIAALKKELHDSINAIKKLRKSRDSDSNLSRFVQVLDHAKKSVRIFVKVLVQAMVNANWNLDLASKSIAHNLGFFSGFKNHGKILHSFVFESFVWRVMVDGFNDHYDDDELERDDEQNPHGFLEEFKKLRSANPAQFFYENPDSKFAKFVKSRYMQMVHPKMECSLFGDLNQRRLVSAGKCPDSDFFAGFLEMAKRVWLLHCLRFSFPSGVSAFQLRRGCRFSEMYMESVTENVLGSSNEGDLLRVGFMVVPGFMISKNVIQSQVYLTSGNS